VICPIYRNLQNRILFWKKRTLENPNFSKIPSVHEYREKLCLEKGPDGKIETY
jgi:hypothetical protein